MLSNGIFAFSLYTCHCDIVTLVTASFKVVHVGSEYTMDDNSGGYNKILHVWHHIVNICAHSQESHVAGKTG